MKKVKINYPNGNVYEYDCEDPYRIYNAICSSGMFKHCKNEIVECKEFLKFGNARENLCDMCPIRRWCNVFNSQGKPMYGVMVELGNDTQMHSSFFEKREDAEKLIQQYVSRIKERTEISGNNPLYKTDGCYHFVSIGNTHWTLYVKEVRYYASFPL